MQKYGVLVKSVEKAILILNTLSEEKDGMPLGDIAYRLDIPKSTVYGLLATMLQYSVVAQNPENGNYSLGFQVFEWGHIMAKNLDIRAIAEPYMIRLLEQFQSTVNLGYMNHDEVLYLYKLNSVRAPRLNTFSGGRLPMHATGIGKAMMAYLPANKLDKIINSGLTVFTPRTISNGFMLKRELEKVRKNGYAVEKGESFDNVYCIAAPVFDRNGDVNYAISVSCKASDVTEELSQKIIREVLEASDSISYYMGYRKNRKKRK